MFILSLFSIEPNLFVPAILGFYIDIFIILQRNGYYLALDSKM